VDGLGDGWSSAAVAGDRIFITGMEKKREFLFSLNVQDDRKWTTEYGRAYGRSFPGAHPSIANGRLYLSHGEYLLACDIEAD